MATPNRTKVVVNVTDGKVIRLLVDDEPFDIRYGDLHEPHARAGLSHRPARAPSRVVDAHGQPRTCHLDATGLIGATRDRRDQVRGGSDRTPCASSCSPNWWRTSRPPARRLRPAGRGRHWRLPVDGLEITRVDEARAALVHQTTTAASHGLGRDGSPWSTVPTATHVSVDRHRGHRARDRHHGPEAGRKTDRRQVRGLRMVGRANQRGAA